MLTPLQIKVIEETRGAARRELEALVPNYFSDVNPQPKMAIERALEDIDNLLLEVVDGPAATEGHINMCLECGTDWSSEPHTVRACRSAIIAELQHTRRQLTVQTGCHGAWEQRAATYKAQRDQARAELHRVLSDRGLSS